VSAKGAIPFPVAVRLSAACCSRWIASAALSTRRVPAVVRFDDRTDANVASTSTSVSAPVTNAEIVAQSVAGTSITRQRSAGGITLSFQGPHEGDVTRDEPDQEGHQDDCDHHRADDSGDELPPDRRATA